MSRPKVTCPPPVPSRTCGPRSTGPAERVQHACGCWEERQEFVTYAFGVCDGHTQDRHDPPLAPAP